MSLRVSPPWYSRMVWYLTLMIFFAFLAILPVCRAETRVIPCATDGNGHPASFNPPNPYVCMITITTNADGSEDIRIDEPVVTQVSFEYTSIIFSPSDLVTLTADGCVQTAGSGSTWKRYVNPSGGNTGVPPNGLYFGTIKIKGATTANGLLAEGTPVYQLTPPGTAQPVKIFIPSIDTFPGDSLIDLTLGYIDDDYTDQGGNGYWGHDNGNNDQCANTAGNAPSGQYGGPAWVKLHVVHHADNPFGSVIPKEWDLVPHGLDANGLALNPEWGWQVTGGSINSAGNYNSACLPGCSSQHPSFDQAELSWGNLLNHIFGNVCNFDTGPSGHRNWFDATYVGKVFWVTHSGGAFGDDDYNMRILTHTFHANPAGTTLGNQQNGDEINIGMEYDSDETIDNFDQSPFWKSFHNMVDNQGDGPTGQFVNGHDAVVVGLMGFDEMHGGYTELHPVHVLAIRESAPDRVDPAHDRWFFFARNWGDEGECSHLQHYLMDTQLAIQVPPPDAHSGKATLKSTVAFGSGTTLGFFSDKDATFVTFDLPDASAQGMDFGEFELAWESGHAEIREVTPQLLNAAFVQPVSRVNNSYNSAADDQHAGDPEERLQKIWEATTADQRRTFNDLLADIYPAKVRPTRPDLKSKNLDSRPKRPGSIPHLTEIEAKDRLTRDAARFYAWCAATEGKLPTQPSWCADFPPLTILAKDPAKAGQVSLTAHDAGGVGVASIEYSFDGKTWSTYSGPFTPPAGTSKVFYRAKDKKGKVEEAKSKPF
jgi:hypothetical protein